MDPTPETPELKRARCLNEWYSEGIMRSLGIDHPLNREFVRKANPAEREQYIMGMRHGRDLRHMTSTTETNDENDDENHDPVRDDIPAVHGDADAGQGGREPQSATAGEPCAAEHIE